MESRNVRPAQPVDNKFKLLSVNAVSKLLGIGYNKAKKFIENGCIESVNTNGALRVPQCKLEKFINQPNTYINRYDNPKNTFIEDEEKALSIIKNIKGKGNGITI